MKSEYVYELMRCAATWVGYAIGGLTLLLGLLVMN